MVDGDILYCSDYTIALADMVRNFFPSLRYLVYGYMLYSTDFVDHLQLFSADEQ